MEKTVIFKRFGKWYVTSESNYNAPIMNENKVAKIHDAHTEFDAIDAIVNCTHISRENIIIKF